MDEYEVTIITDANGSETLDFSEVAAALPDGLTLRNVFGRLERTLGTDANCWVNGVAATLDSPVPNGATVVIAGKLAGG